MPESMPLQPAILTIFGITGDLAGRKLLPALYYLAQDNMLPANFRIVGVTRRGISTDEVVSRIEKSVINQGNKCDSSILEQLGKIISIITMNITERSEYDRLKVELDRVEEQEGVCMNRLFYLAIPAQMFTPIVRLLGDSHLNSGCQHQVAESRLLIEKPLGYDYGSATELIEAVELQFTVEQLYLIDHYLAKPAVQRLLPLRFSQARFEPFWNAQHISRIEIVADEAIGIEGRAVFYEEIGALRDVLQSHLMQVMSLVTMERPTDFSAAAVHQAKLQVLEQVQAPDDAAVVEHSARGQYEGYRDEVQHPNSQVETFAAVILHITNQRWQGMPILLRTGKKLAQKQTAVRVLFKKGIVPEGNEELVLSIDPVDELRIGSTTEKPQTEAIAAKDAYELVMADAMRGDKSLFASPDEVLASWRIVTPVLECWNAGRVPLETYAPGSDGPASALKLTHAVQQPLKEE